MENTIFVLKSVFILFFINSCSTLQCYVCEDQDSNNGKCLTTVDQCRPEYDMCQTEIKWGTMPYWQAGADKQFYISKRCATKQQCEKTMKKYMPRCTHVWYEDWKCSECCAGDKCNYFIMSSATNCRATLISFFLFIFIIYLR
ncbi:coiled [Rhodnius prolixus]